jgi:hypothetical protein
MKPVTDSSIGMRGVFRLSVNSRRFLRPLIGVVVAYSVAAQSLLIALGGFTLPAQADDGTPAFELCLHDGQGAPELPTSNPEHTGSTHCIFCFAGSHHVAIGTPLLVCHRMYVEGARAPSVGTDERLPRLPAYSIANPRGPPLGA